MRALVIEGGGMKAAYANGVLAALEGAQDRHWDLVCGSSAGGALAAWFSAGQAHFATETWRYAKDPRILNYRRAMLRQGPVLDHGGLIDIVYADEHPLDVDALCQAPWPVVVTASDVESAVCRYQDLRQGDALAWIKATGRLPLGSGPAVDIAGRSYVDGGVLDPIPVRWAVEQGARELVLVLNKPPGPKRPDPRLFMEAAARRCPNLREALIRHQALKEAAIEYARDPPTGVTVDIIHPAVDTGLTRLTRDMDKIQAGIELGRRDGIAYLHDAGRLKARGRWLPRAYATR